MSKRFLLSGLLLLFACIPAFPSAIPLPLLLVVDPKILLDLVDGLTRRDTETVGSATQGPIVREGKLIVARRKMDVKLERSSYNWRGRVNVVLKVPSEVTYTIDLKSLRAEHLRIDEEANTVVVTMPEPRIEDVVPTLTAVKVDDAFRQARAKFIDKKVAVELQNAMLKKDLLPHARKLAECPPEVREQAREAFGELLEKVFGAAGVKLDVIVE